MSFPRIEVYPDAVHLPGYLSLDDQRALAERYQTIGTGPAGWYVPTVRGGGRMRVRMVCLGRHWNPRTYSYEATRRDHDGRPAPALPADLAALAAQLAETAGMRLNVGRFAGGAGSGAGVRRAGEGEAPDTTAIGATARCGDDRCRDAS